MKGDKKLLASMSIFHLCNDASAVVFMAVLPILKVVFSLSYIEIGMVSALGLSTSLFFQLYIGRLADKKSAQMLLTIGFLITSTSMILIGFTRTFIQLVLVYFMLRVGLSFYHPVGIPWISREFKYKGVEHGMGVQSAIGDLGLLISFLTTGFIATRFGWQIPFLIWAMLSLFAIMLSRILIVDRDVQIKKPSKPEYAFFKTNLKAMAPLIVPFCIGGAAWNIIVTYGPLLFSDKLSLSTEFAGILIALWIGTGVLVTLQTGKISSKLGNRKALLLSYFMIGISSICIGYFIDLYIITIALVLSGSVIFLTYPVLFSVISTKISRKDHGLVFGIVFAFQLIGGAIATSVSGLLADLYSISWPFYFLGILGFLGFALIIPLKGKKELG